MPITTRQMGGRWPLLKEPAVCAPQPGPGVPNRDDIRRSGPLALFSLEPDREGSSSLVRAAPNA
eukprot:3470544-Alexandrium_andersonii.AAC.1